MRLRIYNYLKNNGPYDEDEVPYGVNYITDLEHKNPQDFSEYDKGLKTYTEYSIDGDLIVKEVFSYEWDPSNTRITKINQHAHFYFEDGTLHPNTKDESRELSKVAGRHYAKKRREDNIKGIESDLMDLSFASGGEDGVAGAIDLWVSLEEQIRYYVGGGTSHLSDAVLGSTNPIFDVEVAPGVTARMYVLNELAPIA